MALRPPSATTSRCLALPTLLRCCHAALAAQLCPCTVNALLPVGTRVGSGAEATILWPCARSGMAHNSHPAASLTDVWLPSSGPPALGLIPSAVVCARAARKRGARHSAADAAADAGRAGAEPG